MPGRPRYKADRELLDSLTTGDVDHIMDQVHNGFALNDIALHYKVTRRSLTEWIEDNEELHTRYKRARGQASHALVEAALKCADDATPETASVAKLRIQARQWTASHWNREAYGEQKQPTVQINLATLHLDALRRRPTVTTTDVKCLPEPDNTQG
jgi:hypothetical protein